MHVSISSPVFEMHRVAKGQGGKASKDVERAPKQVVKPPVLTDYIEY